MSDIRLFRHLSDFNVTNTTDHRAEWTWSVYIQPLRRFTIQVCGLSNLKSETVHSPPAAHMAIYFVPVTVNSDLLSSAGGGWRLSPYTLYYLLHQNDWPIIVALKPLLVLLESHIKPLYFTQEVIFFIYQTLASVKWSKNVFLCQVYTYRCK